MRNFFASNCLDQILADSKINVVLDKHPVLNNFMKTMASGRIFTEYFVFKLEVSSCPQT